MKSTPVKIFLQAKRLQRLSAKRPSQKALLVERVKGGSMSVARTVRGDAGNGLVTLTVPVSKKQLISKETSKLVRAMICDPISPAQREKAAGLAEKAKAAQASSVTAKFRRTAHGIV